MRSSGPITPSPRARLALAAGLAVACFVSVPGADGDRPARDQGDARRAAARQVSADQLQGLGYRFIGPPGNRVSAVVGRARRPQHLLRGRRLGRRLEVHRRRRRLGAGLRRRMTAQSIGSMAIAPSRTPTSSGSAPARRSSGATCRSATGSTSPPTRAGPGRAWASRSTGRIGRIIVDPRNPDIVLARALGHGYGPQQERGVYRTTDGGKTWQRTLFVDENTGAPTSRSIPTNPRIVFAGMWTIDIKTWGRTSGGPGSGVFARATAARRGSASTARPAGLAAGQDCRRRGAKSTRTASTRSSRRASAARSGGRDDGGERGAW